LGAECLHWASVFTLSLLAAKHIREVTLRTMRGTRHAARMGEMRNAYKILVGNLEAKDHSEDLGVDGRIKVEWILRQ